MSRQYGGHSNNDNQSSMNWSRKFQGFVAGGMCGSVIGLVGNTLHTQRIKPGPQGLSAALFMGTVLAVGGAIRS